MQLSTQNAFQVIFPKYAELLTQSSLISDEGLQTFIRNQLPQKIELVRAIEPTFLAFQNQFTNLILKRPKQQSLLQSLTIKASQKIEKYFSSLELSTDKLITKGSLSNELSLMNLQQIRTEFRQKLKQAADLLKQKYFDSYQMDKSVEQAIARKLYVLNEIYYFLKNDLTTVASKYRIKEHQVLNEINKNGSGGNGSYEIADLLYVDDKFVSGIDEMVDKRYRPFVGKKDFFFSKLKQIQSDTESKVPMNLSLLIQSILGKEKYRLNKDITASLSRELKTIDESLEQETQKDCKEIITEVDSLKREFNQIKNNVFYLDIIRGTFSQKYKMEINKLENIYYLSNIEKYLQDVQTFTEKLIRVEEKIIDNRKTFMRRLGKDIQDKIAGLITDYEIKNSTSSLSLRDIIDKQFDALKDSLYGIINDEKAQTQTRGGTSQADLRKRKAEEFESRRIQLQRAKEQKQRNRRQQLQEKAQRERIKRQEEKIKLQQRRRAEDQRIRKMREERQDNERVRKMEQAQKDKYKQVQMQQKRKEMKIKQEQQRERVKEQMKRKQEQKRRKEAEDAKIRDKLRNQKEFEDKKRSQQMQAKKRQMQETKRRRDQQQRNQQQKQRQEKQRTLQLKKDQEQRQRKERQNRLQQEKQERQRRQRQLKAQKQKQELSRKQLMQREREQKEEMLQRQKREKEMRQQQERDRKDKQRLSQVEREKKENEEKERLRAAQMDKDKRERQERQRKQRQEKQRKERQETQKKQKEQSQRRQKQQNQRRQREQKQRKQKEDRERRQKEEKQRRQRQDREQRQRKDREQNEQKQRELKQKRQREQKQREKKQKQEKQRKQREEMLQKQRRQKEQRDRKQKQEKEKERIEKQKQQKEREKQLKLKKEKQEKEKKEKDQKEKKERQEKQKRQLQLLMQQESTKKNKPKQKPKGGSGINYQDLDDMLDDDLDYIEQKQSKVSKKSKAKDEDYGDDYDDDFQSPQRDQQQQDQGALIQPKQLITLQSIKCLNDYMKGTSYSRKNKPNLEPFNNSDAYTYLFEEFMDAKKLFIFSSAVSNAILDFSKEMMDENAAEEDLRMSIDTIKEEMFNDYTSKIGEESFDPRTVLVLPFGFKNQFDIKVIQFLPEHAWFRIVMGKDIQDQEEEAKFNSVLEGLLHIFEIEAEPTIQSIVIPEQSLMVLETFQKQLPCLLTLFVLHYQMQLKKQEDFLITQYTVERFFYTIHVLKPFYQAIENNQDDLVKFYQTTTEKYAENNEIRILPIEIQSSQPDYEAQLQQYALQAKQLFIQQTTLNTLLVLFQVLIVSEEEEEEEASFQKIVIYCSMQRVANKKPQITYFIISKDQFDKENASTLFDIISEGDDLFDVTVFMDFTRHNGLTQYSDWTLPLWARTIQKRKLQPVNAFRAISFAMSPYYVAFKEQD